MIGSYVQAGGNLNYTNASGSSIAAGTLVIEGKIVGIAAMPIETSETGTITTRGVFEFEKDNTTIAVGDTVYYDAENDKATASADNGQSGGSNKTYPAIGIATEAAATAVTTVKVKIG